MTYIVDIKNPFVSISCSVGSFTFNKNEVVNDIARPEIKELAKIYYKIFRKIEIEEIKEEKIENNVSFGNGIQIGTFEPINKLEQISPAVEIKKRGRPRKGI